LLSIDADDFTCATEKLFDFVTQLIDDYPRDTKVKELVDSHDWYLLPVVNPDGYSYTWTKVSPSSIENRQQNIIFSNVVGFSIPGRQAQ